ncbi:hypothetical protein FQR65_LT19289 [Abscondita terminalis]|nr:hypothetical protein FQR65_LT19289 [Abscondita terminalis]
MILSSDVHIVGHSLGGQMSGLIGQMYFKETGEKLDRLTGLDPADAVFVDVIHTNGGMFGYYGNCGTADFYINCGSVQPNCYVPNIETFTTNDIEDLGTLAVACSHRRSLDYMIEAVSTKSEAIPCSLCPIGCPPILSLFKSRTVMGEDCDRAAKAMVFNFPAFSYIIALIGDAFLIFFSLFHVIAFDELKTDYKNPIDQCNSLNPLVLPEYLLHLLFNILFAAAGEWLSLIINMPLIAYHINRYRTRPVMSGPGLYDPTSIMNADTLTRCQREGWIKLAFYLLSFFYYLYGGLYDSPSLVVDSVSDTSEEDSDDDNNGIRSAVSNILHPGKKNKNVIPRRIFEGTTDINEVGVKLQEYIKNLKQVTSTPVNIHVPNFQTSFKLSPIGRHRNSIISEHLVNVNSKLPNVTEKYKQATVPENDENIVRSVDPLNTHDRSKKENPEFNKQEHGKKSNKILPTNLVNIRGSDLQKPSSDKNWINTALSDLDCSVFIHSSIILKNGATTVNNNDQQQTLHITKATELSDRKLRSASNDTINKKPCCISDEAKINNKSKTVTKATIKNSKSVDVKKSSSNKIKYPLSDVNPHTGNHKPETTLRTYKTTAPDSSQNVTAKMTPVKDKTTATEFSQNISSDEVNEGEQLHCSTRKRNSAETLATQVTLRRSKRTASAISQDMPMDEVNACLRNSESDEQLSKNSGNPDGIISPEARDKRIMNKLSLSLSDVNAQVINFKPDKRLPNIQHSTLTTGTKLSSKTKVNDVSQNIPFNEVNASKPDEQLHHSSGTLKSAYVRISKCIKPPDLSRGNSDVILTSHQNMTVSEAKRDEVLHRNSNNSETISDTERTLIRDDGTSDLCQFVPLDEVNTHVRNLNPDEQLQCSSGNLDAIHTTVATSSKKTATNLSQNMTQSKVSARVKTSKLDRSSEISNVVATTLTTLRRDEKISDFSQNMPLGEVNTHKRNRKPDELLDCSRGKENSYAHETRSKGETNVTSKKQVKYKRFKQGVSNTKKQRKEPESNTTQQTSYNESAWNQESDEIKIVLGISTRRESSYRTARERHTDPSNGKRTTGKGSQRSSANQTKKISNNNTNNRINLEAPEFHPDMDFNSNTTSTTTEELVSIPESTESNAEEDQFEIRRKPTKRKAKSPIPTSSLSQTTGSIVIEEEPINYGCSL